MEYKKKKIQLKSGGTRYYYYKINSKGKKERITKEEYLKKTKVLKGGLTINSNSIQKSFNMSEKWKSDFTRGMDALIGDAKAAKNSKTLDDIEKKKGTYFVATFGDLKNNRDLKNNNLINLIYWKGTVIRQEIKKILGFKQTFFAYKNLKLYFSLGEKYVQNGNKKNKKIKVNFVSRKGDISDLQEQSTATIHLIGYFDGKIYYHKGDPSDEKVLFLNNPEETLRLWNTIIECQTFAQQKLEELDAVLFQKKQNLLNPRQMQSNPMQPNPSQIQPNTYQMQQNTPQIQPNTSQIYTTPIQQNTTSNKLKNKNYYSTILISLIQNYQPEKQVTIDGKNFMYKVFGLNYELFQYIDNQWVKVHYESGH